MTEQNPHPSAILGAIMHDEAVPGANVIAFPTDLSAENADDIRLANIEGRMRIVLDALGGRSHEAIAHALGSLAAEQTPGDLLRIERAVLALFRVVVGEEIAPSRPSAAKRNVYFVGDRRVQRGRGHGRRIVEPPELPDTKMLSQPTGLVQSPWPINISWIPDFRHSSDTDTEEGSAFSMSTGISPALGGLFIKAAVYRGSDGREDLASLYEQIDKLSDYQVVEIATLALAGYRVMQHAPQYSRSNIAGTCDKLEAYLKGERDAIIGGLPEDTSHDSTSPVRKVRRDAVKRLGNIRPFLTHAIEVLSENEELRILEQVGPYFRLTPTGLLYLRAIAETSYDRAHSIVPYARYEANAIISDMVSTSYKELLRAYEVKRVAESREQVALELKLIDAHFHGLRNGAIARRLSMLPGDVRAALDRFSEFLAAVDSETSAVEGASPDQLTEAAGAPELSNILRSWDIKFPTDIAGISRLTGMPEDDIHTIVSRLSPLLQTCLEPTLLPDSNGVMALHYKGLALNTILVEIVGISPDELAKQVGVPPHTVQRILASDYSTRSDGKYDAAAWRYALHEFRRPTPGSYLLTELARMLSVDAEEVKSFICTNGGSISVCYDSRGEKAEWASPFSVKLILAQSNSDCPPKNSGWLSRDDVSSPPDFDDWSRSNPPARGQVRWMRDAARPGLSNATGKVLPHYPRTFVEKYNREVDS